MVYGHYWHVPKQINPETFTAIVKDFKKITTPLKHLKVPIYGPGGHHKPIINKRQIAFNGLVRCGHPTQDLMVVWPSDDASGVFGKDYDLSYGQRPIVDRKWKDGFKISSRTCDGNCAGEPFNFEDRIKSDKQSPNENGLYRRHVMTDFKPYDLAITSCLVIAKEHLGDNMQISSDGKMAQWNDAMQLCDHFLFYGSKFTLDG